MLDNLLLIAAAARLGLSFYLSFKKDGYDESLICLLWRISRRRGRPGKTTGLALEIPRSAHTFSFYPNCSGLPWDILVILEPGLLQ